MKPIFSVVSFYPFSFIELSKKGWYAITRYNTVKHKWVTIGKRFCTVEMIQDEVHELNEDAGLITETFIVGYKN